MVIHEDIGINLNLKPFRHVSQNIQKRNTIIIISKNILRSFPRDRTCPRENGDVIVRPFKFYAPLSCHSRQDSTRYDPTDQ